VLLCRILDHVTHYVAQLEGEKSRKLYHSRRLDHLGLKMLYFFFLLGFVAVESSLDKIESKDPLLVATVVSEKLIEQPFTSQFWDYAYGPSIAMSSMYDVSAYFNVNLTRALDRCVSAGPRDV
jgi:hypothetical protein